MLKQLEKKKLLQSLKPKHEIAGVPEVEGTPTEEQGESPAVEKKEDPKHLDEKKKKK